MGYLDKIFKDKAALTQEEFLAAVQAEKMNLVDLSEGGYVSADKFKDRVDGLSTQLTDLKGQLTQRDADMATLRESLQAAQADAGRLPDVQKSLADMQTKYEADKTAYEAKLAHQAYEFAVREKANQLKFSSASAKKAFVQEALSKELKMDGESLLGYDEFLAKYKADDPTAFMAEKTVPPEETKPKIVLPGKDAPGGAKRSLTELMRMKNENPDMDVVFNV